MRDLIRFDDAQKAVCDGCSKQFGDEACDPSECTILEALVHVPPVDAVFVLRQALAHMWYAYVNKDGEHPHEFELEAVREAERLLGKWEDCMPIMMRRVDDGKTD